MVKRRNEKVAHLVLESTFTAEKRQCDGKKRSFGCWKSSRLDCTIMFAYGVNECSQMVVGTCMSGGRMRAFPKKKSPLQWTWPDLTLVFFFAKVSHLSPNKLLSNGKAAGLFVCFLFAFIFYKRSSNWEGVWKALCVDERWNSDAHICKYRKTVSNSVFRRRTERKRKRWKAKWPTLMYK